MADQQYLTELVMNLKKQVEENISPSVVSTFNNRTGNVLPILNDYSIDQISNSSVLADANNIDINNVLNGQVLTYSNINSKWINQAISTSVSSVFGRTGNVIAAEGDYNLTQLGDVTITLPLNNQLLSYNGATWVNSTVERYITSSFGTTVDLAPTLFLKPGIGVGDNNFNNNCVVVPVNCTAISFTGTVSVAPGSGNGWIFYLSVNNVAMFLLTISDLNTTGTVSINQPLNQGDLISIYVLQNFSPSAAKGYVSVLMRI